MLIVMLVLFAAVAVTAFVRVAMALTGRSSPGGMGRGMRRGGPGERPYRSQDGLAHLPDPDPYRSASWTDPGQPVGGHHHGGHSGHGGWEGGGSSSGWDGGHHGGHHDSGSSWSSSSGSTDFGGGGHHHG